MLVRSATVPLPDAFRPGEPGLLTKAEFLRSRNPQDKYHESGAYDWSLADRNEALFPVATDHSTGVTVIRPGTPDGNYVFEKNGSVVAVLHDGTLYYAGPFPLKLPHVTERMDRIVFNVDRKQRVKYPQEYVALVSRPAQQILSRYPYVVQNIQVAGESCQIRAEQKPVHDAGTDLFVVNSRGEIVAQASNEWGATLLATVREYRGKGIGTQLGKLWYSLNPRFTSGGFTQAGERNAIRIWEDRCRTFLQNGWYSALVRRGDVTQKRVDEILADVSPKKQHAPEPVAKEAPQLLIYSQDSVFCVYDSRFLTDPDEKYIHGHGFFRDAPRVGTFLYSIDYDRPYRKLTTIVALQQARDAGDDVYVGEGYGDLLELDGIDHVERTGDYVRLTQDIIPLHQLSAAERRVRRDGDPYDERTPLLLEAAESKWN